MTSRPLEQLDRCIGGEDSSAATQPFRKRRKFGEPVDESADNGPQELNVVDVQTVGCDGDEQAKKVDLEQQNEYALNEMVARRLKESHQPVYIPPMAIANLQARDEDLFPLMEKVQEFLASDRQVMLVLGDSGAGKSTFNKHLEAELLHSYDSGGRIPLFINLPALGGPANDIITEQLREHNFSEDQIQELKQHRQFIAICDGYDEGQFTVNLHTTNNFNRPGQWNVKLIISCRTQYLGQNYRSHFIPQGGHDNNPILNLFQEALIAPFSIPQIQAYVELFVPLEPRIWKTQDYMETLATIPNLMDLVRNPFLLSLTLEVLPTVTKGEQNISTIEVSRVQLYDIFIVHWLSVNKRRLESNTLSTDDRVVFDQLLDAGFILMGIDYSTRLARAIFEKQDGNPVVQYGHLQGGNSWQAEFFGPDPVVRLLRESAPLTRTGSLYRFLHRSMQEYFFSCAVFDPSSIVGYDEFAPHLYSDSSDARLPKPDCPLFTRNLLTEPAITQFLSERVQQSPAFKMQLLDVIEESKTKPTTAVAAANAITILVRAGVAFHGQDLRGVSIPGADISGGQFDSAQLQGADLTNVNLGWSWLRQADFCGAQMKGVQFGEAPYLAPGGGVFACTYSPDGMTLVLSLGSGDIAFYDTFTWTITRTINICDEDHDETLIRSNVRGHCDVVLSMAFSPCGRKIASTGQDAKMRLWDSASGELLLARRASGETLLSVAFSPCGKQIASASDDGTVHVWDSVTGESLFELKGHSNIATSVEYSPDGDHLISASKDGTIRFWDLETGEPGSVWESPFGKVFCLAISPDGQWIVSGHGDGNAQIWNALSGELGPVLGGHNQVIPSAAFSPNGQQIATSSGDATLRLWDVASGSLISAFTGHDSLVVDVSFSPDGTQLASASYYEDEVRLWEVNTSGPGVQKSNIYVGPVKSIAFSPSGSHVISTSADGVIRQWDGFTRPHGPTLFNDPLWLGSMAISPDGNQIATNWSDPAIRLWNRHTGESEGTLEGHTIRPIGIAYLPCGQWIVSVSQDATVRLWDLYKAENRYIVSDRTELGSSHAYKCLAVSPTGLQLAAGCYDNSVELFDVKTRRLVRSITVDGQGLLTLAYSPNSHQLAISCAGNSIVLWDMLSEKPNVKLEGHHRSVASIAFSPCGRWMLSGSYDNTVRLWRRRVQLGEEKESWSCVAVVRGFLEHIDALAWNPVEPMEFATGCKDHSVRLWRISDRGEESVSVGLVWGSNDGRLCASDLRFRNAIGLSPTYQKLLLQRGAVDDP